jgi:purine-nucleoside phosphorylase
LANYRRIDPVSDESVPPGPDPFAQAEASAAALRERAGVDGFDAAVVLGSGWQAAADAIGTAQMEIPLAELGGFKQPRVKGHSPSVRYIRQGQRRVLVYLGRIHL